MDTDSAIGRTVNCTVNQLQFLHIKRTVWPLSLMPGYRQQPYSVYSSICLARLVSSCTSVEAVRAIIRRFVLHNYETVGKIGEFQVNLAILGGGRL